MLVVTTYISSTTKCLHIALGKCLMMVNLKGKILPRSGLHSTTKPLHTVIRDLKKTFGFPII